MKTRLTVPLVLVAVLLLSAVPAYAGIITIDSGAAPATFSGFGVVGKFDLAGAVADRSSIQSATAIYHFCDDIDTLLAQAVDQTPYVFTGRYAASGNEIWERDVTTSFYDEPETALVFTGGQIDPSTEPWTWIGGQTASRGTGGSYYESLEFGGTYYDFSAQNPSTGAPMDAYTRRFSRYHGYTGAFQILYPLDAAALTDLKEDGLLNFLVGFTDGDATFLSASLRVETSSSPVPDAGSSLLLLGISLAGLRAGRKRWQ